VAKKREGATIVWGGGPITLRKSQWAAKRRRNCFEASALGKEEVRNAGVEKKKTLNTTTTETCTPRELPFLESKNN